MLKIYLIFCAVFVAAGLYIMHIQRQNGELNAKNQALIDVNNDFEQKLRLLEQRNDQEKELLELKHKEDLELLAKEKELSHYVSSSKKNDTVELFNDVLDQLFK